jgi:hypothetical protein
LVKLNKGEILKRNRWVKRELVCIKKVNWRRKWKCFYWVRIKVIVKRKDIIRKISDNRRVIKRESIERNRVIGKRKKIIWRNKEWAI